MGIVCRHSQKAYIPDNEKTKRKQIIFQYKLRAASAALSVDIILILSYNISDFKQAGAE